MTGLRGDNGRDDPTLTSARNSPAGSREWVGLDPARELSRCYRTAFFIRGHVPNVEVALAVK